MPVSRSSEAFVVIEVLLISTACVRGVGKKNAMVTAMAANDDPPACCRRQRF
jgi:hypothetical protein